MNPTLFGAVLSPPWVHSLFFFMFILIPFSPLLLAAWAGWRLRGARPAGGLGRAYLLACYAGSAQLTPLRGERLLPIVRFVILMQCAHGYGICYILALGRTLPGSVAVGIVCVTIWLTYGYIGRMVIRYLRAWHTAAAFEQYSKSQRRAWGLLGQAYFWGAYTFMFISIGLRGMLVKHLHL